MIESLQTLQTLILAFGWLLLLLPVALVAVSAWYRGHVYPMPEEAAEPTTEVYTGAYAHHTPLLLTLQEASHMLANTVHINTDLPTLSRHHDQWIVTQ